MSAEMMENSRNLRRRRARNGEKGVWPAGKSMLGIEDLRGTKNAPISEVEYTPPWLGQSRYVPWRAAKTQTAKTALGAARCDFQRAVFSPNG